MLKGPEIKDMKENEVSFDIPSFIQIKNEKEGKLLTEFVGKIVSAANANCVKLLEDFFEKQNACLTELLKKLGAG